MAINKAEFFHQGTRKICASLDIQEVLQGCLEFLKDYMPLEGIMMNIYDQELGAIRIIGLASDFGEFSLDRPILLGSEAREFMESKQNITILQEDSGESPVAREVCRVLGLDNIVSVVMPLPVQSEVIGVVVAVARHKELKKEHGRYFLWLKDPFTIAMSNALRYQEVVRLQEMLKDDNTYLQQELHRISGDEIIGEDFGLREVMAMVRQVAPMESHVLLLGETGVGKEVIANAIHFASERHSNPLVRVNCGAIPDNLVDSELFGHEKGAFTGALERRRGRFERADKGTIFLDEIGELPLAAQVRLLHVIQNKQVERVGGSKSIPVDVRIVCATHRDLSAMVASGEFREDLYFRLNVFPITIPPLRHRKADIPALVEHFIERKAREMKLKYRPLPSSLALERLQQHHWPGNVRELGNAVERELIRTHATNPGAPLQFDEFMPRLSKERGRAAKANRKKIPQGLELDMVMAHHIRTVLDMTGGKVQGEDGAAALMGVHPSTLRHRMRKLSIAFGRK